MDGKEMASRGAGGGEGAPGRLGKGGRTESALLQLALEMPWGCLKWHRDYCNSVLAGHTAIKTVNRATTRRASLELLELLDRSPRSNLRILARPRGE